MIELMESMTGSAWAGFVSIGVLVACVIACIAVIPLWLRDWEFLPFGTWMGAGCIGLIAGLVAAGSLFPYQGEYLFKQKVAGEIQEIDSRLIGGSGGMSERYVFTINGQEYGVDDTRAVTVEEGDTVALLCNKEFVFGSDNHGWACAWSK